MCCRYPDVALDRTEPSGSCVHFVTQVNARCPLRLPQGAMSKVLRNRLQFHLDASSALIQELCDKRDAESGLMCDKCADLNVRIERCQRLLALVTDKITIDGIEMLLATYLAQKLGLHPEGE
jgi:hypothetical protein